MRNKQTDKPASEQAASASRPKPYIDAAGNLVIKTTPGAGRPRKIDANVALPLRKRGRPTKEEAEQQSALLAEMDLQAQLEFKRLKSRRATAKSRAMKKDRAAGIEPTSSPNSFLSSIPIINTGFNILENKKNLSHEQPTNTTEVASQNTTNQSSQRLQFQSQLQSDTSSAIPKSSKPVSYKDVPTYTVEPVEQVMKKEFSDNTVDFDAMCHFQPKQIEALKATYKYQFVLFGGARGPGKSYWLRWAAARETLSLFMNGVQRPRVGLFSTTYTSLQQRQASKIDIEFPSWLGKVCGDDKQGKGFHFKDRFGGGIISFCNLDNVDKYKSAEFAGVYVDELTENGPGILPVLMGSLRWPGVSRPKFAAATNPDGIGHLWVKSYWIDKVFPEELQSLKDEFCFISALPGDNKYLDEGYWRFLDSLPEDMRKAWRDGDWNVFQGQFFNELSSAINGFPGCNVPDGYTFISLDYGETAPSAAYWCRVDSSGTIWVYREVYGAGMIYSALAKKLVDEGHNDRPVYVVASPDIFGKSKGTGVVGAEVLSGFPYYLPMRRADDDRVTGWRIMKEYIHDGRLKISTTECPNFWRTAPSMVYDKSRTEDMDGRGEDHSAESIRYAIMSRPPMASGIVQSHTILPNTKEALEVLKGYYAPKVDSGSVGGEEYY